MLELEGIQEEIHYARRLVQIRPHPPLTQQWAAGCCKFRPPHPSTLPAVGGRVLHVPSTPSLHSPGSGRQGAARRAAGSIRDDGVDVVVRGIGVGSDCVAPRGAVAHSGQLGDVGGRVARRGEDEGDGVVVEREEVVGVGVIEDWGKGRRRGKEDFTPRRLRGKRRKMEMESGNGLICLSEPRD